MQQKAKEKGADLVLDIVKYVITAGLLATMFGNITAWNGIGMLLPSLLFLQQR